MGDVIHSDRIYRRRDAEATDVLLTLVDQYCPTKRGRDALNAALDRASVEVARSAFRLGALTFGANALEADAAFSEMMAHVVVRRRA